MRGLAMQPLSAVFLFFAIWSTECGKLDDAKELINSFRVVVDLPLSKEFGKAHRFFAFSMSFMKRAVPFAELFATALKIGLKEDQLDALLTLTNGISDKVNNIARQQYYIQSSTVYRDLLLDYRKEVSKTLGSFLGQIQIMSMMQMNVTQVLIDTFVNECNAIHSPRVIAQYLANFVEDCADPSLSQTVVTQLFDLINSIEFKKYTMTKEEHQLFYKRFAVVYFWLSSHPTNLSAVFTKLAKDHSGTSVYNKLYLLKLIIEELGIRDADADKVDNLCLPKAAFIAHGYKRDSIEHFADLLMEHLSSLEYVTIMCANITFYGHPGKANIFTLSVKRILEPVYSFVSKWFDALLKSTWPTTESLLIRNIMQDLSEGTMFPETNKTYEHILDVVYDKMQMIGHRSYRRQYIATRQRTIGSKSTDFAFACKPNACTISSTMNAHCITIRTQVDTNRAFESLQKLIEFRSFSWPIFYDAMDKELYCFNYVERAVDVLAKKYKLDFRQFTNHSSYVVLRQDAYPASCLNAFAIKCDEDLDNTFFQTLNYQEDGTLFSNCQNWLVILGF